MRWFTSDHHFGHTNIIKYCNRPWSTVEEMNEGLISRWNEVVADEDVVWVLGDVTMRPSNLGPVSRLKGKKYLVAGNHDSCWTGQGKSYKQQERYLDAGFLGLQPKGSIERFFLEDEFVEDGEGGGLWVAMSHFPYTPDPIWEADDDRFAEYRLPDKGLPLLCGHVHDKWKTNGRMLNVGVDVWNYYPVPEKEVIKWARRLP